MKAKALKLFICAVLAVSVYGAFAQTSTVGDKTSCDASNQNKCVIYNVGEGTGKLVTEAVE